MFLCSNISREAVKEHLQQQSCLTVLSIDFFSCSVNFKRFQTAKAFSIVGWQMVWSLDYMAFFPKYVCNKFKMCNAPWIHWCNRKCSFLCHGDLHCRCGHNHGYQDDKPELLKNKSVLIDWPMENLEILIRNCLQINSS